MPATTKFLYVDRDRALRDLHVPPPPQAGPADVHQTPREHRARRRTPSAPKGDPDEPDEPSHGQSHPSDPGVLARPHRQLHPPLSRVERAALKKLVDVARRKQSAEQFKPERALFDGDPGRVTP